MRLFRNMLDKIGWSSGHAARLSILNIVLGLWTLVWILIGCMFVDLTISPVAAAFVFPIRNVLFCKGSYMTTTRNGIVEMVLNVLSSAAAVSIWLMALTLVPATRPIAQWVIQHLGGNDQWRAIDLAFLALGFISCGVLVHRLFSNTALR